jgi:hypothetical protein
MQRRRLLRLAFGILAGTTAALLSVQIALADSMILGPTHGQPTDPVTATYTYVNPTGGPCPAGQVTIDFWWDSLNNLIGSAVVNVDTQKNCVAVLKFVPAKVPGANTSVSVHLVVAGQKTASVRSQYTIDPPPPSPTPTPTPTPAATPTPTPTPRPTPPTTTTPSPPSPATNATPTPPPVNSPPAVPSSSPEACKAVAASTSQPGHGGLGGGLALTLVLAGALPISGMVVRRRQSAKIAVLLAIAGIVVGAMSCGRAPNLDSAASPTPSVSVPAQPAAGCYQER